MNEKQERELTAQLIKWVTDAERFSTEYYSSYNKSDELFEGYVVKTKEDLEDEENYGVTAKIYIPLTYSIVSTIASYLLTAFTTKLPFVEIEGRSPRDVFAAKAHTIVANYQMQTPYCRGVTRLYQFLVDVMKYNVGWLKISYGQTENYEGIFMNNVHPYFVFTDPNVSLAEFQDGNYIVEITKKTRWWLKQREKFLEYFNVDKIPEGIPKQYITSRTKHPFLRRKSYEDIKLHKNVLLEKLHVKIVPADWGLSDSDEVEIWKITLANRQTIIQAEKTQLDRFPFVNGEWNFDMYSFQKSLPLLIEDIQKYINFMYNSHLATVRRAVNLALVVDPSLVDVESFKTKQWVKLLLLNPIAYGRDVRKVVHQLTITDITQNNMRDAEGLIRLAQMVTGATELLFGVPFVTKRSATEIAKVSQFAANRLTSFARLLHELAFAPLFSMITTLNQLNATEKSWYKITKGWEEDWYKNFSNKMEKGYIGLGREDLQGQFNFVFTESLMPIEKSANLQSWLQLYQASTANPMVMQRIDVFAIFKEIAKHMGIKNISDFEIITPSQPIPPGAERIPGMSPSALGGVVPNVEPEMKANVEE